MPLPNTCVFCLTADVDWASDYCIADFVELCARRGVRPTLFATHKSAVLDKLASAGQVEIGLHPNFAPGSTHGGDVESVIEHVFRLYPQAACFRSHSFFDSTGVSRAMFGRGIRYDSNLCLYLQQDLVPLRSCTGLARFPVFWEDDVHWDQPGGDWKVENHLRHFVTPGLKVINVHPFNCALNAPSAAFYRQVKPHIGTLTEAQALELRFGGEGVRSFLEGLLDALCRQEARFRTLGELYGMYSLSAAPAVGGGVHGRQTAHTEQDHALYWSLSDEQKQEFLRQSFKQRNAGDAYATSRDANIRELEIAAIRSQLGRPGPVLDLGCGNGHTLQTLARALEEWTMVGVDFVEEFIDAANQFVLVNRKELKSAPDFRCANAANFVQGCRGDSFRYILTQRFIQNLPSPAVQKRVLSDIHRALQPGGKALICEGSQRGFDALNDLREQVGLGRTPATSKDNVSAIRLQDDEFEAYATRDLGFHIERKLGFSTFFAMARVLHPLLVWPEQPRFDARINDLARRIQMCLPFEPGIGSNVLWVLGKE